jgi:hypothetical protein
MGEISDSVSSLRRSIEAMQMFSMIVWAQGANKFFRNSLSGEVGSPCVCSQSSAVLQLNAIAY